MPTDISALLYVLALSMLTMAIAQTMLPRTHSISVCEPASPKGAG